MDEKLSELGLSPFFTQQLSVDEIEHGQLARVFQVQRTQYILGNGSATWPVEPGGNWYQLPAEQRATVGGWVVLESDIGDIGEVGTGVSHVFDDIDKLARQCRFG